MISQRHNSLGDDMSQMVAIKLEVPDDLARFRLPPAVNTRLQELLDRRQRQKTDSGGTQRSGAGLAVSRQN
jgi:hypothetical protein